MKKTFLSPVVAEIDKINLNGNIIPHAWFQHPDLRLESGATNLVAIILLSDLVYWHRPVVERDEATNQIISIRNKFSGEKLQRKYETWGKHFSLTKRQVQDAVAFLHKKGLIVRDQEKWAGNIIYLTPVAARIADLCAYVPETANLSGDEIGITFESDTPPLSPSSAIPITFESDTSHASEGEGVTPESDTYPAETCAFIKTSIETSLKTTSIETKTADYRAPEADPVPVRSVAVCFNKNGVGVGGKGESLTGRMEKIGIDTDAATDVIRDFGAGVVDEAISSVANRKRISEAETPTAYLRSICDRMAKAAQQRAEAAERKGNITRAPNPAPAPPARKNPAAPAPATDPDAAYATLSDAERAAFDDAVWARAMADAPVPFRSRLEVAAKSQDEVKAWVRPLLLAARNALLTEAAAARKRQIDLDFG